MYITGVDKRLFKDYNPDFLNNLINQYPGKKIKEKIENDIKDIKNKLGLKLLSNLNINYWIVRGWDEEIAKHKIDLLKEKRKPIKHTILSKEYWINKGLSKEEAKEKVRVYQTKNSNKFHQKRKEDPSRYKQSSPMTVEFWINKGLSEEESKHKIKTLRKLNIEYWINKGYSKEKAIEQVRIFQLENKQKYNAKKEKNAGLYNDKFPTQLGYWIKKCKGDIIKAKEHLKEHQTTFSLDICIEKYGELKGLEIFEKRQKLWKNKVFNKHTYIGRGTSNLSNEIINEISKYDNSKLFYNETEKFIYDSKNKRAYKYDLTKPSNKKIIEINGTYWHCKPSLYESTYIHKIRNISAKEIWDYDNAKKELAEKYGYDVLVIWEDDYNKNKKEIINKCIKFLKDE